MNNNFKLKSIIAIILCLVLAFGAFLFLKKSGIDIYGDKPLSQLAQDVLNIKTDDEYSQIRSIAKDYTLSKKAFKHILTEHSYKSNKPKSKFIKNFDIKYGIEQTLLSKDSEVMNNSKNRRGYIFIKDFNEVIGYDGNKALKKLKVVISDDGYVITAFPTR